MPMKAVKQFHASSSGISGQAPSLPLRQILIVPTDSLKDFNLNAQDLRCNVVLDWKGLHDLNSGTILLMGEVKVRLTFHCESCDQLRPAVDPKKIAHRRGFLGQILSEGIISVGDHVEIDPNRMEPIPFNPTERIEWFLKRSEEKLTAVNLLSEIGFSRSYCRVLPRWLEPLPDALRNRIVWSSK